MKLIIYISFFQYTQFSKNIGKLIKQMLINFIKNIIYSEIINLDLELITQFRCNKSLTWASYIINVLQKYQLFSKRLLTPTAIQKY